MSKKKPKARKTKRKPRVWKYQGYIVPTWAKSKRPHAWVIGERGDIPVDVVITERIT